ncbi:unnamed protein product [Euphydryas editha]|uniref:C2H2-type domain-containing protein n=1 Tax=Euphydryas editha TaxID=104508 RepID=A0AAU9TZY2_EUPED|nr:unnamed protein product [Euphydryas editha]
MPTCFLCNKSTEDVKTLFKHFNSLHFAHNFTIYHCMDDGCGRSFHLRNTFRKHLKKQHVFLESNVNSNVCTNSNVYDDIDVAHSPSPEPVVQSVSPENTTLEKESYSLPIFLSSLYANPLLPRNAVQSVVEGMSNYMRKGLSQSIEYIFDDMLPALQQGQDLTLLREKILSALQSPLEKFQTEHKRLKYFTELGSYIPPKQIIIGRRMSTLKKRGVVSVVPIDCTEQFIPLRLTLQKFFSLDNILTETLNYIKCLSAEPRRDLMENYIQGSFWVNEMKNHKSKGKVVLPLFMFFDDYESGNVLGSHSGIHKLGAVYVSIGCIPPDRAASLSNIFLALLFHSSDRVKFGNGVIFQPLIEEFNFLLQEGIEVDNVLLGGKLYFQLALIIGDNLGLHSITGFAESFTANFPCRICNVSKNVLRKQCYENNKLLRNTADYQSQLAKNDCSKTGIKEKCVWLSVNSFRLFDQVGVDVMHDILEGVAKYVMCFLLSMYIRDLKYFPLQVLNDRISCFDYGPDNSSKPCALSMEDISHDKLRLSASEMLTFLRYFGLLIGDFLPTNEQYWILYTTLRKIVDLVTCQKITSETCDLLQCLIAEFNELYLALTNDHLKPKFHFLVHYSTFMKKFGPLINFWSMRFEAKHRLSKIAARATFNRRNLTLTLAIKHQMQLNEVFLRGYLNKNIEVGPAKRMTNEKRSEILAALNLTLNETLFRIVWAKVKGTEYRSQTILIEDIGKLGETSFMSIKNIYVYSKDRIIFECILLSTIEFNDHVCCFEVEIPKNETRVYIFQEALLSHVPNHINIASDGKRYVTLRSQL